MIASDEPWVRAPVVSPGAWNRSASIRMQRCSISAVRGYSAWSMKLRCRLSAMSRCASGSIQVVTNVARLRAGSPSKARSSATSRIASDRRHAGLRERRGSAPLGWRSGFRTMTASTFGSDGVVMGSPYLGGSRFEAGSAQGSVQVRRWVTLLCSGGPPRREHQHRPDEEAQRRPAACPQRRRGCSAHRRNGAVRSWPARTP